MFFCYRMAKMKFIKKLVAIPLGLLIMAVVWLSSKIK